MKRLIAMVAACVTVATVRAETPVPFEALLEKALQGPAAQEARTQIDRASAEAAGVRGGLLPQASASVQGWSLARDPGFLLPRNTIGNPEPMPLVDGERQAYSTGITAEQLLWDFGKATRALRAARLGVEAARLFAEAVDELVRYRTVMAVAEWDRTLALSAATQSSIADKQELVHQITALVNQEQAPQAELLQAQAALALAHLEEADRGADLGRARAAVERLTGEPLQTDAKPYWPPLPPLPDGTPTEVAQRAMEKRPTPRAYARVAESARAAASAVSASRLPEIKVEGTVQRVDDSYQLHKDNATLAIVASIPLTTGGKISAERASHEADARRSDAQSEQACRETREQVAVALAEDQAASARIDAATAAEVAASEALRLSKQRYDNELISGRDLLSSENDASHARQALAVARTGQRAARLAVRIAAGEPLIPVIPGK